MTEFVEGIDNRRMLKNAKKLWSNHFLLLDLMELKMMMEKLDQAKTHLELKKMISEVDRENLG